MEQPWRASANVNDLDSSEINIMWLQTVDSSKLSWLEEVLSLGVRGTEGAGHSLKKQ